MSLSADNPFESPSKLSEGASSAKVVVSSSFIPAIFLLGSLLAVMLMTQGGFREIYQDFELEIPIATIAN